MNTKDIQKKVFGAAKQLFSFLFGMILLGISIMILSTLF